MAFFHCFCCCSLMGSPLFSSSRLEIRALILFVDISLLLIYFVLTIYISFYYCFCFFYCFYLYLCPRVTCLLSSFFLFSKFVSSVFRFFFKQLTVDTDRTVVAFYKFIKKHASIPFKLQRPEFSVKSESESQKSGNKDDLKDEL